jgi:hypothetical protein
MNLHFNLLFVVGLQAIVPEAAILMHTLLTHRAVTWLVMFRLLNCPNQFGLAHVPRLYPEAPGLISNLSYLHRVYPVTPI